MRKILLAATFLATMVSGAFAQIVPTVPPTVSDDPFCADRPAKGLSPCVMPQGTFQIESDLYNWTKNGAVLFTNPTLRYGIGHDIDIQLSMSPYEHNQATNKWGNGDLYLRVKWKAYDNGTFAFALMPYVKAPTAPQGIGNGFVEGGFVTAVSYNLPAGFIFMASPEVDQFHNVFGGGYYTNLQAAASIQRPLLDGKLIPMVEFWQQVPLANAQNLAFLGRQQQSVDFSLAYMITPSTQVDVGFNLGLTESTPRQQAYVGITQRF